MKKTLYFLLLAIFFGFGYFYGAYARHKVDLKKYQIVSSKVAFSNIDMIVSTLDFLSLGNNKKAFDIQVSFLCSEIFSSVNYEVINESDRETLLHAKKLLTSMLWEMKTYAGLKS